MRVHGEIAIFNDDGSHMFKRPWRWLLASLAGFLFWSAVIAAVRQVLTMV